METILKNQSQEASFFNINTNQVLVEEKKDNTTYYLPCYVRLKVKSVNQFEVEKLSGVVSATLLFGFYHGNLPEHILEQFTDEGGKAIILQFPRQSSIELKENTQITLKQDIKNKILDYVIRTEFSCNLSGDVLFTPFQIFNLYLSITIQTIVLDPKKNNGRNIHIKFNCMNSDRVSIIDANDCIDYGSYTLASYFLDADMTNSANHRYCHIQVTDPEKRTTCQPKKSKKQIKEKEENLFKAVQDYESNVKMITSPTENVKERTKLQVKGSIAPTLKEKKLKNFQYVHFRIPLYKYPVSSLMQIFIPLWILAAINLGIYYQDPSVLADKIASIATVTLALVAFIPTINAKIPQTSMVKVIQVIIYLQVFTNFLTLLDSLVTRKESPATYQTDWKTNPFFMITLIINTVCVLLIVVMLLVHKLWWEKVYTKPKAEKLSGKFNKDLWQNKECDDQFKKQIISNKITVANAPECERVRVGSQRSEDV